MARCTLLLETQESSLTEMRSNTLMAARFICEDAINLPPPHTRRFGHRIAVP
jgi:hypothetical protein